MNKKKICYILTLSVVTLSIGYFVLLPKIKTEKKSPTPKTESSISNEKLETNKLKLNGVSVPNNKQIEVFEQFPSDIPTSQTFVKDGDKVKKGDLLINYRNPTITESLKESNTELANIEHTIKKLQDTVYDLQKKLKNIADKESSLYSSTKDKYNSAKNELSTLKSTKKEIEKSIVKLKENEYEERFAKFNGYVYLNKRASFEQATPSSLPYLTVIEETPCIKGIASEIDITKIKQGEILDIRIINNNETLQGEVVSIDELPSELKDGKSFYNFYIKPTKPIRIGFSVEIVKSDSELNIPKECILEKDGLFYVGIQKNEEITIKKINISKDGELHKTKDITDQTSLVKNKKTLEKEYDKQILQQSKQDD